MNLSDNEAEVPLHSSRSISCQIPYEAHNVRLHLIKPSCGVSSLRNREKK